MQRLQKIKSALNALKQGRMIILCDDEHRENEGDLIIAAEKVTPEAINFMARFGRGLICLTMLEQDFERLQIPMMVKRNTNPRQTAFGVSIEAKHGVSTGISAADRSHTILTAIDENNDLNSIVMPGHIFPLKARDGGVLVRDGHTEGSVDLARLAGFKPAAVLCEIMKDDGTMARYPDLMEFARTHHLEIISIRDLLYYRIMTEKFIHEKASADLPLQNSGDFWIKVFVNDIDQREHVALIAKKTDFSKPVLTRLHSECLTGDVFASARCDCGAQLNLALERLAQEGGVLIYLRQEGRGIGLTNKIKAYALQDMGLDTVEANHQLGFPDDARDYGMAMQILRELKITSVRLLTNNPRKIKALNEYAVDVVERVALESIPTDHNISYLNTKREKLGHILVIPAKAGINHES